jgi:oligopeptide/dipeptide ABC transporter ATP-binding protein
MSAGTAAVEVGEPLPTRGAHDQGFRVLRDALRIGRTRLGLGLVAAIILVALLGPVFAPYTPEEFVGIPNSPPSGDLVFGTDELGRDVLSRFLGGGATILWLSLASACLGVGLGVVLGLVAAYARGWPDEVLMRLNDVGLAFPQILFSLLLISAVGPKLWLIVVAVGLSHAPRVARVIRAAALEVAERDFVKASEAVGEKRWRILTGDLLPNVSSTLMVEIGLRITYSVWYVAALSFLGFGLQPPAADWGLMINENRVSISSQPWAVLLPASAIALMTVGVNLVTDGIARAAIGIEGRRDGPRRRRFLRRTRPAEVVRESVTAGRKPDAAPVVNVEGLCIRLYRSGADVIDEVALDVQAGEILGLIGESGSGKTTLGLSLLGYTKRGARLDAGAVDVDGQNVARLDESALRSLRGRVVSYIAQDPAVALNPALRIRTQILEVLEAHAPAMAGRERRERVSATLREVGLPDDDAFLRKYPHQLSGGQQQRVTIAMAFITRPSVIVCDEPTTGVDVTTQARVLATVRELCRKYHAAVLYISHDLAVVVDIADRVAVMYAGRVVEQGPRERIFSQPHHPYTRRLLAAVPDPEGRRRITGIPGYAPLPGHRPQGCFFAPRCPLASDTCLGEFPPTADIGDHHTVRCYHHEDAVQQIAVETSPTVSPAPGEPVLVVRGLNAFHGDQHTLHDVDLDLRRSQCLSLVGESGSGKTTLARCIAGLHRDFTGAVQLGDILLPHAARDRSTPTRKQIQYVFQNPYASLNPRRSVAQILTRQLRLFHEVDRFEAASRVADLLDRVRLSASAARRYPEQLSGGERQRVAIARALAAEPTVLVCDEVTSALDVSVQAAIVSLLDDLRREMGLAILFITHNLALVRAIGDNVAVMTGGRIVEHGSADRVLSAPKAEYTRVLVSNTPSIEAVLAKASLAE